MSNEVELPWQYNFPPFFTIQPHAETRGKQLNAWENLILEYMRTIKTFVLDVNEALNWKIFNNIDIKRKLSQESLLTILEEMEQNSKASPRDKGKAVWEIYWHSLDEWASMIYNWASQNGLINSVCTLYEIAEGDDTQNEEFHGLDSEILIKALKKLQLSGKCEVIEFDDNRGVKFF